jgi:hypothetical protein
MTWMPAMNIAITDRPLKNNARSSKSQGNDQSRFNKLWQEVVKKQKRNEKFKEDMDALFLTYAQEVIPVEVMVEKPLSLLAYRLIDFFGKKSLSKRQRVELDDWIMGTLMDIARYNAQAAMTISQAYNEALADFFGMSTEELIERGRSAGWRLDDSMEDPFGFDATDDDDDNEDARDPDSVDAHFNQHHADYSYGHDTCNDGCHDGRNDGTAGRHEALFNDQWIKNLFRRTARVLHPDKEQDAERRLEKQQLMSRLLQARDQQDILTMLQLHNDHVDAGELAMESQEVDALCKLLQLQKYQLDAARDKLIYSSPMHSTVYENLYGATQKTRDRKLEELKAMLHQDVRQISEQVSYLRNLASLKRALDDRYEDKRYNRW